MIVEETRKKIMSDDQFVIEQLDAIALYYELKHTIRWDHSRNHEDVSESVAEHVYGMNILLDYFLPLIDPKGELNGKLLHSYITWHDMAEALVSDMPNGTKTEEHKLAEKKAEESLVETSPKHLTELLSKVFSDYDSHANRESELVKAIDKIEPMFHLYFLTKKNREYSRQFNLVWSPEKYREYRYNHIKKFEILVRFDEVLYNQVKHFHPDMMIK